MHKKIKINLYKIKKYKTLNLIYNLIIMSKKISKARHKNCVIDNNCSWCLGLSCKKVCQLLLLQNHVFERCISLDNLGHKTYFWKSPYIQRYLWWTCSYCSATRWRWYCYSMSSKIGQRVQGSCGYIMSKGAILLLHHLWKPLFSITFSIVVTF